MKCLVEKIAEVINNSALPALTSWLFGIGDRFEDVTYGSTDADVVSTTKTVFYGSNYQGGSGFFSGRTLTKVKVRLRGAGSDKDHLYIGYCDLDGSNRVQLKDVIVGTEELTTIDGGVTIPSGKTLYYQTQYFAINYALNAETLQLKGGISYIKDNVVGDLDGVPTIDFIGLL